MDYRGPLLFKRPRTHAELATFLGKANYYRKWIMGFEELIRPLVELKNCQLDNLQQVWKIEHETAFQGEVNRLIPMLPSKL